jgi:hypothetical protein
MALLNNLPGVRVFKNDGNLAPESSSRAPRVLVVGQAAKGVGDQAYLVSTTTLAKSEFGTDGTLIRGMWEALKGGAKEVLLYRIGATSAKLEHVGDSSGVDGYTIETVMKDDVAGASYAIYYGDATDRIVITRLSDDLVVYDNDSTSPIDLFEVTVSGFRASAGGPDVGTPSGLVDFEDVTGTGIVFTAGTDGLSLSRMELYEKLYVAYKDLLQSEFDVIVPMDVYLDDLNIVPAGNYLPASAKNAGLGVDPVPSGTNAYPTAGAFALTSDVDALGKVFVQEYEGKFYFWWDTDSDNVAELWPASVGSASASTDIDGNAIGSGDFHEVNFAYQLARFLYDYSTDIVDATGVIGVLPPTSNSLTDKARWLGKSPTWTLNTSTGEYTIASASDNGTGLLGNKFMVGSSAWRSGVFGGGFILTDSDFMDGAEEVDENEIPIDLGKYISVVADHPFLRNNWYSAGYRASFAASYAGFYVGLPPASAPTNKKVNNASIIYKMSLGALDSLTAAGFVTLRQKAVGVVVTDSPTATMPESDWKRLSTVRIVKAIVDGVRAAVEPFIGEGTSSAVRASMQNAVETVLMAAKKGGYLQTYKPFQIIQTPSMEVQGVVSINLTLIPAFEIRQIELTVNVSKSG